ncbi:MAG TPA: hypothetical protein ENK06_03830 [Gammaproteobacteria bacterium]|nr:hypothetical protein [Gammaproteobacteria bacterium]
MKFSTNYIIYPNNRALLQAIEHYKSLISDSSAEEGFSSPGAAVRDNFLYTRGNFEQHRYSNALLESARDTFEAALNSTSREEVPLDWAALHNSLGNILAALAQQMQDADLYAKAVASFNHALEVLTQEKTPKEWAATQYNLGTAAQALGRLLSDSKVLKSSVDAYTNALLVWTREDDLEEWAAAMHQLGLTFHTHGLQLQGNRTFQKSVVAYKNALAVLDADNYALELAATHNNRGAVLHHLGESEENAGRLEEAIRSYDTGLTVCLEQQLPFHLAVLCRVNRSTARSALAELTKDRATAEEASDEFELIIECFDNALQPLCKRHCEEQLSKVQSFLAADNSH